ncbi:MAG: hypothetical protein M1832_000291 [Thelocarpon impressellum]|nr:MAG: hypothetical protein M1832_000291 [Thelocarpon impressellum]
MSASPAPSNAADDDKRQEKVSHITFQFCKECSNMLYPKEDPTSTRLMFACRTCQFSEPAASACVFRNILSNNIGETEGVTQDVAQDPTVGAPDFCTLCGLEIMCFVCDEGVAGSGSSSGGSEEESDAS